MKALLEKIRKILRSRRTRQLLTRAVSGVAAIVVFITTYALVLPAITMEQDAFCGIPEHQHTDACYEERLVCEIPESEEHHHDASCYEKFLICGKEVHTHSTECYQKDSSAVVSSGSGAAASTALEAFAEPDVYETGVSEFASGAAVMDSAAGGQSVMEEPADEEAASAQDAAEGTEEVAQGTDEVDLDSEGLASEAEDLNAEGTDEGEDAPEKASENNVPETVPDGPDNVGNGLEDTEHTGQEVPAVAGDSDLAADSGQDLEGTDLETSGSGSFENIDADTTNPEDAESKGSEEDKVAVDIFEDTGDELTKQVNEEDEDLSPEAGDPMDMNEDSVTGSDTLDNLDAMDTSDGAAEDTDGAETEDTALAAGTEEAANDATTNVLPEPVETENLSSGYVPELDGIEFGTVLNKHTDFFYFHPEEGQEPPASSAEVTDWKKVKNGVFGSTKLGSTDLVKMYLSYTIPAGALNETNQVARYRLPSNIHLTDDQIIAINATENGMSALYADAVAKVGEGMADEGNESIAEDAGDEAHAEGLESDSKVEESAEDAGTASGTDEEDEVGNEVMSDAFEQAQDENTANYQKYLGAEAIEGTRTPDEKLKEGAQEYISAIVKAENVFDKEGLYGEKGAFLGQDLIFIFTPYSIEKNQTIYNADGDPVSAGEKITGWFACDFNMSQIDWVEEDTDLDNSTVEKTAEVVFVEKDSEKNVKEISRKLKLVDVTGDQSDAANGGETAAATETAAAAEIAVTAATASETAATDETALASTGNTSEQAVPEETENGPFKSGTLTADGDGYRITLDYTEEAKIPENAELSVREITAETDREAYEACLEQAGQQVAADDKTSVDRKASRFFDIEILVKETEDNDQGETHKIEPAAPVSVKIQIIDDNTSFEDAESTDKETSQSEPAVLHFAEEGVEQIDSTVKASEEQDDNKDRGGSEEPEPATEISFEAESFSIYGVVYTVDFEYSVNGKMYQFSLPGGGFVSFTDLVEVLGIIGDTNTEDNGDENRAAIVENTEENPASEEAEENGVSSNTNTALTLDNVEVSDATRKFVADVESVEFSSPELVDVSKVENETTVGQIKESRGLECQYSAELTEEQIAEINAQTVEAGDWALISMQPFASEESLTVTMKNGEVFSILVTDAQRIYKSVDDVETGDYLIYSTSSETINGVKYTIYRFLKNDGTTVIKKTASNEFISASELADYTWHFTKINDNGVFTIKSTKSNTYLTLPGNNATTSLTGSSSAYMKLKQVTNSEGYDSNIKIYNYDETKWINWSSSSGFIVSTSGSASLNLFKIESSSSGGGASGIVLDQDDKDELDIWKETLERFDTLTSKDKIAEVYNYDNRIYKIDITADSGITDFYKDVDLGFVLDVSNSMNFPSSLSGLCSAWMSASDLDDAKSKYSQYYSIDDCFYIISDPALTSTVYKVFKDGSQWKWQDASVTDGSGIYNLSDGTLFKEPYRQQYTLYYADDTNTRFYYLKNSVNNAIETLNKIVTPTEEVDDETASVSIAYNLFAKTIKKSAKFVDLRTRLNDFALDWSSTDSGTRQNVALYDAAKNANDGYSANEFGWDSYGGTDKYVILVTDGAPNGPTIDDVETAARNLKAAYPGLKIITVGLSTQDVDGGSQMLSDIADSIDGVKQFYEAETANDLEYILLKILRTIMTKGLVQGKITDNIDEAFYPVDINGEPIREGVYNVNGQRIGDVSAYVSGGSPISSHANEVFYTWELVDGKWKITWYNQEIGWDDNDSTTGQKWKGTIYVKAKEDYLGGNLIETNDRATFQATGIKLVINGSPEDEWRPLSGMPELSYPVPRVNVHNLETQQNDTVWTVYKGTSVTPGDQIKALWDAIPIEEVVSASQNEEHKITTGSSANIGKAGTGETFSLGDLMSEVAPDLDIDTLISQITSSKSSASQEFTYTAYGHESGKITVTVERTAGSQNPATHTADTVGTPVEQYKVTFTYKPFTEAERKARLIQANELDEEGKNNNNYHNGSNGRGTEETGTLTSTNTHTINVFQKGIRVTKVDKTNPSTVLPGAVFELFQVDSTGTADVSAYNLPTGTYSKVGGDLTADESGIIMINPVIPDKDTDVTDKTLYEPNINVGATTDTSHDTVFYLVEKTPPTKDGVTYAKMPGAIKFTMTLTEDKGTDSTATLHDWTQTAVIAAEEYKNGTVEYLASDGANTTTGTNSDIYAYTLKNGKPTDITLIKTDKNSGASIPGAKFRLVQGSENVDLTTLTITAITGGGTITPEDYDFNGTTIKVVTVPEGGIKIAGLVDDTYTLYEVAAPAGYIITDSGKTFKTENGVIKNSDDSAHANEKADIAFEVKNEPGAALPNTGGPGTRLFTILGSILILGAGVLLWRRRRLI